MGWWWQVGWAGLCGWVETVSAPAIASSVRALMGRTATSCAASPRWCEVGVWRLFGLGVAGCLGLGWSVPCWVVSWFLAVLLVMAVVRGAFYGFVEDGPLGAGTWGGPTMAGAWAVHAAVSVPIIAGLLFVFRGIGWLHGALVRRLYGLAGEWVLLATISVCAGSLCLMWSWIQQL